jgi:tetratricopeptide (TPR) repeat protein
MKSLLAALMLVTANPAFASAATLFHDGRFTEAAAAGRAEGTAASLVIAGRATIIVASFDTTDRDRAKALVDQADRDADAALALAPNDLAAQLQKATTVGYRGKLAKSPGLAKETRARMEAVLTRDPSNGLAWASLGGWHAGAVSTIGKFLAGTVLGANVKVAVADFETAIAKDPKNPVHPAFYGLTLLDLGIGNAPRALQVLQMAARDPARDAYEGLLKKAVVQVIPLLTAGDVDGAQTLARKLLPFGKLA